MSEKLLLSENSRESRMRMRETSSLSTKRPTIATKTKIVVHINNYLLPNEDTNKTLRHLTSPASSIDYYETDFPNTEYRYNDFNSRVNKTKHDREKEHEYMILKAKSLNFPLKVRSSYAIYHVNEDKKFTNNYSIIEKKLSNIINYEFYKKLPLLNGTSRVDQQTNQTLRQMFLKDRVSNPNSLPHYLKPNNNLMPTYSIINKSKSDPKLAPIFSYKKAINERNNFLLERFQKIDHLLKKRERKKNQQNETKNDHVKEKESNKNSIVDKKSNAVVTSQKAAKKVLVEVSNDEETKKSSSDAVKLPYLMKTFDPNEFSFSLTNHSNELNSSLENFNEFSQLSSLPDDVDDKINKIIKNYPSIVLRRQGNRRFPKLKKYLTDNHIKYEISQFKIPITTATETTTNTTTTTQNNMNSKSSAASKM